MKRAVLFVACVAATVGAVVPPDPRWQEARGDLRVLVIRATWGPAPDSAAALGAAAPFYERASFGQLRLHLDITPWLRVYEEAICPHDDAALRAAARDAGYDLAAYARVAYVLPEGVCDTRGFTQSLVRQLGLTFGLDPTGDPLSPMGRGTLDFSAYEKLKLGWATRVQRVDGSRTYAVADIDTPSSSPQALVVPTNAGEYWIEHRSDDPRRLIVRLVTPRQLSVFTAQRRDRFVAPTRFSVTSAFTFKWIDRKRPTRPSVHALDETVLWWSPSIDSGSGVASYRVAIDGKRLADTTETSVTLPELHGTHRIAVSAVDRAGNRSRPGTVLLHLS